MRVVAVKSAYACSVCRIELYVILCSDDVYNQETPDTIVNPEIPYEDVSKHCTAVAYLSDFKDSLIKFFYCTIC